MRRRALVLTALLVIALLAAPSLGAAGVAADEQSTAAGSLGAASASAPAQDGEFDRSVVRIRVSESGDGAWTFRYERTLETDAERDEFEAFAAEFRENETDRYRAFKEDARGLVAEGDGVADREMNASDFSRDAFVRSSLGNDIGVVEQSFTWEGFAATDGDRVVVGDVFEGGIYVGPDQELVVAAGDGLAFTSVDPSATQSDPDSLAASDTVTWSGERQFTDRRPRVVLRPASAVTTPSATPVDTTAAGAPATETTAAGENAGPWTDRLPLIAVLAALFAAVGAFAARRFGGFSRPETTGPGTGGDDGEAEEVAEGGASAAGGAVGGSAAATATEPAVPDEELLSDEDRVVGLLREHGGRMKQHRIVDETGWSKSKVSVLLSEMADEGTVSKLRVGRENVVSLDGAEPAAADSPFDEE